MTVGPDQVITAQEQNDALSRIRSLCFSVAITSSDILSDGKLFMSNLRKFADEIRRSPRVKEHIKQFDDIEIAENYHLIDGEKLTNLGVLWRGSS